MSEEYDEDVAVVKTKKAKKSKRVKEEPVEEPRKKKIKIEDDKAVTSKPAPVEKEEERVVQRTRTKEDVAERNKERLRIKQSEKDHVRKNKSRTKFDNLKVGNISYDEAVMIWKMHPSSGFEVLTEKRHVSLSYHLLNPASIQKSLHFIASMQIGRFRNKVQGIVVAVGSVTPVGLPRVIDDQNVFHMDCKVQQVVFRPVKGARYEAKVTFIGKNFVSALVFQAITCNVPIDDKFDAMQKGMEIELNDIISVKYERSSVKAGEVRLHGIFVGLVKKGDPNEAVTTQRSNQDADYKNVKNEPTAKKLNKVVTFHDSDSE